MKKKKHDDDNNNSKELIRYFKLIEATQLIQKFYVFVSSSSEVINNYLTIQVSLEHFTCLVQFIIHPKKIKNTK